MSLGPGTSLPAAQLVVPAEPASARVAREFVRHQCQEATLDEDVVETVLLLTSEVVTNAVIHGRSEARLAVAVGPQAVRVEVGDDNSRHPAPAPADDQALDGRGMALVEALALAWGVRDEEYGKVVWFDVPVAS